jgi:hypothetical protein
MAVTRIPGRNYWASYGNDRILESERDRKLWNTAVEETVDLT